MLFVILQFFLSFFDYLLFFAKRYFKFEKSRKASQRFFRIFIYEDMIKLARKKDGTF